MRNLLYIVFSSLFVAMAYGQMGQTHLELDKILVGQQIRLTYHLTLSDNDAPVFDEYQKEIPLKRIMKNSVLGSPDHISLEITKPFTDTVLTENGKREWFGMYVVTAWDSGFFQLPIAKLTLNGKSVIFPETNLTVNLIPAKQGQDIYDIQESFTQLPPAPFSFKKFHANNWWWMDTLLILLLGFIIYFRWKKVKQVPIKMKELSLKERTLLAIDGLDNNKLWLSGKLKQHYIELSFILRSYFSARYELNLLEKTTQETKLLLLQKGLHKETVDVVAQILNQADMVKFAKSAPEEMAVLHISVLARQIVAETSPLEFEYVE